MRDNPVKRADKLRIKNHKVIKPRLDPRAADLAAEAIAHSVNKAWFNVVRFVGLRKDEGNRLEWWDINLELSMIHIRGNKTEGAYAWLSLARVALETLHELRKISGLNNPLVFPWTVCPEQREESLRAGIDVQEDPEKTGIKLMTIDLIDYGCDEVAASTRDPAVLMRLMRYQSLETMTKSLRTVSERIADAVKNLGSKFWGANSLQIRCK